MTTPIQLLPDPVVAAVANTLNPPDFSCRVCGKECATAPDWPVRAICEECCEDHEYEYVRGERGFFCKHCNRERPWDW